MNNFLKTDSEFAKSALPKRYKNSNKGSYGRLLVIAGSARYPGAAHLCLEAALRGGAGYVTLAAEERVTVSALKKFPEALYVTLPPYEDMEPSDFDKLILRDASSCATVIGPGVGVSESAARLAACLLKSGNTPLIIDADAINSLAKFHLDCVNLIKNSARPTVLTPHPLEFSRISSIEVEKINESRTESAVSFAKKAECVLLLKGYGTVITDGERTYLNTTGSSALAKAGSGDCLAGLLGSLLAQGAEPLEGAALAAYIHGRAGDTLSELYSEYGVTPSDLPKEMAKTIKNIL